MPRYLCSYSGTAFCMWACSLGNCVISSWQSWKAKGHPFGKWKRYSVRHITWILATESSLTTAEPTFACLKHLTKLCGEQQNLWQAQGGGWGRGTTIGLSVARALEMSTLSHAPKCSCLWGFKPSHSSFLPSSFVPTKSQRREQAAVPPVLASLQQVWLILFFFIQISPVNAVYIWW